jgi:hypothetical protein
LDSPAGKGSESSLGDLFGRLADDGRAFVKAEADLYKTIALRRADKAKYGLAALVAGALLLEAALIVLLVGLALALSLHIGPVLGGLVVAAAAGLGGYLLIRWGAARMTALSGDQEEKAALAAGEIAS